nr:peroxidase family protein [Actinomadura sp. CNU-125]
MKSSDGAARRARRLAVPVALVLGGGPVAVAGVPAAAAAPAGRQSLDGSGNNVRHRDWGRAGTNYARVARARYADGKSEPVTGRTPGPSATGCSTTSSSTRTMPGSR